MSCSRLGLLQVNELASGAVWSGKEAIQSLVVCDDEAFRLNFNDNDPCRDFEGSSLVPMQHGPLSLASPFVAGCLSYPLVAVWSRQNAQTNSRPVICCRGLGH